jgi:hypothetical protein
MPGEVIRAKARELMHAKTCEFCHTTFGEHSEEQFDACWNRLREEHKRLIAAGKIPAPKLSVTVIAGGDSPLKRGLAPIRQLHGEFFCPICDRRLNGHSDAELKEHLNEAGKKRLPLKEWPK